MGRKSIVAKLKKFKKDLGKKIQMDKIIFFGSHVSGKPNKNSDIDLIVVSKSFRKHVFRERAIGFYDYWDLDYPVDFLCYTPEEFKKLSGEVTIVREAVRHGIEI